MTQLCVVVIEVTGLTKSKLFNIWPRWEHVCQLLQYILPPHLPKCLLEIDAEYYFKNCYICLYCGKFVS